MRYMLDAFAADRAIGEAVSKAFAFVPVEAGQEDDVAAIWRSKGVEPILYKADDPKSMSGSRNAATLEIST